MVLAFEVDYGDTRMTLFWWMLIASYQHGHHPATSTLWKCLPDGTVPDDYAGLRLCVEMDNFVQIDDEVSKGRFLNQGAVPRFYDDGTVAAEVAGLMAGGVAGSLRVRKLLYREELDSSLIVSGVDEQFPALYPQFDPTDVPRKKKLKSVGTDFLQ